MAAKAGAVIRAGDVAVQACRVTRSTSMAIPDNTTTTVDFPEEQFDTDGMHSTSTNNSRITFQTAGFYVVGFSGQLAQSSAYSLVMASIVLNGATLIGRIMIPGTSTNVVQRTSVTTMHQFSVSDYIEVQILQQSTAARTLEVNGEYSPIFYAARLGS